MGRAGAKRPRVAWFSPLNLGADPIDSVSAYTTDLLLPHLQERFEIDLFHRGFGRYGDLPTYHYLSAVTHHAERPYDLFFYQLEDSKHTDFVRIHLGLMPGAVWFHDLFFSTYGPEPILNSPWQEVVKLYNDPACPWPGREAEYEPRGPLGFREAALAGVRIFSSERSHSEYRRNMREMRGEQDDPSFFVPYPVKEFHEPRPARSDRLTVAYCGTPRIEHRAHKVLQALSFLAPQPRLRWLIAESERVQAEELAREFQIEDVELVTGRAPERWSTVIQGCDAAVHTLFSVFSQPGPYLAISLAAGLPSLVTNFCVVEYLDDRAVFKIEPGEAEATQIAAALRAMVSSPSAAWGREGYLFAREQFDCRAVAGQLVQVIERSLPRLSSTMQRWDALQRRALGQLLAEAQLVLEGEHGDRYTGHLWDSVVRPALKEFGV